LVNEEPRDLEVHAVSLGLSLTAINVVSQEYEETDDNQLQLV